MRIAVAGFQHESNTFARERTGRKKFEEDCLSFGDDLVPLWKDAHHEVGGFLAAASESNFTAVPLLMAKATPAGPVEQAVFEEITSQLVDRLKRSRVDGLLLGLHGAMVTEKDPSGDTAVLRAIRDAVGPDLPIVLTLDFHGNLTAEMVAATQAILFYQTNPHTDMRAKGIEAGRLMRRIVAGEIRPVQAFRKPPLIIPINHQATANEPLRTLLASARAIEKRPGMLTMSLAAGFPYADVPAMGPAVVAVADGDASLAERSADELAEQLWQTRSQFEIRLPSAAEAVAKAIASKSPPVVLVDFGDNVGGGSAADGTFVLEELLRQKATRSVLTIADPEAVSRCIAAGVRQPVSLTVGGKTDDLHGRPVEITGIVRSIHDGQWIEDQARHGGVRFNDQGVTAVVTWGEGNLLCLSERRYPPFSLGQITSLGIDPAKQQILVVKAAIAYRAAYEPIAGEIIEVDTPGLTAVNPAHFTYQQIRRPIWPLDS